MNRRAFVQGISALAVAPWACPAHADAPRVAILSRTTAANFRSRADAFVKGMRDLGYVERQSVRYEWRHADDDPARVAALAGELAASRPALAVADSTLAALRLRQAAPELAVVVVGAEDPVADGLARTLAEPGRNATGITAGNPDEILKSVHYLDALVKKGEPVAMLFTQNNAHYRKLRARFRHAALEDGMQPVMLDANAAADIPAFFEAARRERAAGFVVMADAMFFDERARIVKLAAAARRPAIYPDAAYVKAGGLMSFGPDLHGSFARAASFVDRILKGAAPGTLPMEAPGDFRLTIHRGTARALKLAIPKALLEQATLVG